MKNLVEEFCTELRDGSHLVVMPLSRVLIEHEFSIAKYRFYPAGEVDISSLRPVPNKSLSFVGDGEINDDEWITLGYGEEDLRELATAVTGARPEVFMTNPLLAFTMNNLDFLMLRCCL